MSDSPEPDGQIAIFLARWFGRSYRTTLSGGVAIVCTVASMMPALAGHAALLQQVATLAGGAGLLIAKDSRVSGRPNG
jgi:hypothetical protein